MKALLCLLISFLAANLIAQPIFADSARKFYSDDLFGFGICLGKGAGAFGVYTYVRPIEFIGFEANAGKRVFIVVNEWLGTVDILWPYMLSGKTQFYFTGRQNKTQFGIELGAMLAEDAGPGGEIAGTMRYRLNRNLNFDMNLGVGAFIDQEAHTLEYLIKEYGVTPDWYTFRGPPIFLMWGLGLSLSF